jgi:hypothetical protein
VLAGRGVCAQGAQEPLWGGQEGGGEGRWGHVSGLSGGLFLLISMPPPPLVPGPLLLLRIVEGWFEVETGLCLKRLSYFEWLR